MKPWAGLVLMAVLSPLVAQTWSDPARDALKLELSGRLSEALEQYHALSLARDYSADSSSSVQSLRLFLLSKLANLLASLGHQEESWEVGNLLLALGTEASLRSGTAVHNRLLGVAEVVSWTLTPGTRRLWDPSRLPGESVSKYWRLQLGAFRDWDNARTLLDMLIEKGWFPLVDDRGTGKNRLVAVFVVSHHAVSDSQSLSTQGFQPSASAVSPHR